MTKNEVLQKLLLLQIGSCTCLTKSPLPSEHRDSCKYKVLTDIREWVKQTEECLDN